MTLKPLPFLGKRTDFNFMIPKEIMRGNLGYFQIIVTINAKPDQKELTFRCKGGAVIKGPKALIMEKCEYLQVASKYDPAGVVLCPEFSVESVSLWILYLFHGTSFFSPSIDLAVEVSYFADRCNTPELQNEVACKVIGRNLTRLDLNDVLNFAFNLRMFGLAEKVATYIIENKSVLAEVSVTYEDEFLEFWFVAFHNVFLRYLKGEYIPSQMEEKAKGLAKIWKQKTFISELERTLSFFVNH